MFERYLTDALTNQFGHFVENLDADKVRLSAWNGELVLEDLSLRTNALQTLMPDCPVELAYGKVGNLEIRIPWTLFRSQLRWRKENDQRPRLLSTRCSIVLSDVNILVTPRRQTSSASKDPKVNEPDLETAASSSGDPSNDETTKRMDKELRVQSLLDANLLRRVTQSSVSSSRWSWVQDYLSSLLSTLSVTVRNIHIRYEDPGSSMGFVWRSSDSILHQGGQVQKYRAAFAVGITLQEFSVDSENLPAEPPENEEHEDSIRPSNYESRHKIAAAERLAVYWDSDCKLMTIHSKDLCQGGEFNMELSDYYESAFSVTEHSSLHLGAYDGMSGFAHASLYHRRHSYLLDPISPSLHLKLVSRKETTPSETVDAALSSDSEDSTNDEQSSPPNNPLTPASSMRLQLPPCKITLARTTLEDTAYIRKSLSVWQQATKGILSESTLRRLATLRPASSPLTDPRRWWFYAVEATLALNRINERQDHSMEHITKRRRRGWIGMVEAVRRRRRYIDQYQTFFIHDCARDKGERIEAHDKLLAMEDELLPKEIVAFRLAALEKIYGEQDVATEKETTDTGEGGRWQIWTSSTNERAEDDEKENPEDDVLSANHRSSIMREMLDALARERSNFQKSVRVRLASAKTSSGLESSIEGNPIMWKTSMACKEFTVQVNDESPSVTKTWMQETPVIRMCSALVQDQSWYQDGSWDMNCSLASLLVQDLTPAASNASQTSFPNLVGRKVFPDNTEDDGEDILWIEGAKYYEGLSISIRRKLHWKTEDGEALSQDRGSTTRTQIRIRPMEVVYSTIPVELATRVLGAIKTPELVDDYHRMAAAAHGWRQRQKKKFLAALAHKQKKIILDIDVGAPELLIPENINCPTSPMLAIDLGRLRVFNDESENNLPDFDDKWCLMLSNLKVRRTTVSSFRQSQPANAVSATNHLLEPFSLDLVIATKIASEDRQDPSDQTKVHITATLPRLAFNITSSSIRLISRLQLQWAQRRKQRRLRLSRKMPTSIKIGHGPIPTISPTKIDFSINKTKSTSESKQGTEINRIVKFDFTAPVISLRLDEDVNLTEVMPTEEGMLSPDSSIPLIDLAFHGIRGNLLQQTSSGGNTSTQFDARLHSLGVIDLFQPAGDDFALLMSSSPPEHLDGLTFDGTTYSWAPARGDGSRPDLWRGEDLVTIQYSASNEADSLDGTPIPDKLSVGFHELYMEWNPETLAMIQKAIRTPKDEPQLDYNGNVDVPSFSDDESLEFFDAVEEASNSTNLVSELASACTFETAGEEIEQNERKRKVSFGSVGLPFGLHQSTSDDTAIRLSPRAIQSSVLPLSPLALAYPMYSPETPDLATKEVENLPRKPFDVAFKLSKLRVSFNKESRHRKVVIAQMDGFSTLYRTRVEGGSRTTMQMGNLIFIDPASTRKGTLYDQILGLKTRDQEGTGAQRSSLLSMEILINPRTRTYKAGLEPNDEVTDESVTIDRGKGRVVGCNFFVQAKFSPMRFVFLEQYWFEIIDYFFEGVIGTAVWGGKAPPPPVVSTVDTNTYLPGSDAKGFGFTRFDISLEAPELLFPVTYRSPHFLRLELSSIHVANRYDADIIKEDSLHTRMQWFNNCAVALSDLRLFSWNGRELGENPVMVTASLRWPSGPTAPLVIPKWRVKCTFDCLAISLRRTDYALVQHIITHNIGEKSRHLDEWQALQNLAPDDFMAFTQGFLVRFNYDKKDVTPTTYDLEVKIPVVSVQFVESEGGSSMPIAVARCLDVIWCMKKESDLVVKQKVTCDVNLGALSTSSDNEKLLSSWKYDQATVLEELNASRENDGDIPELTYTSTTQPSGDNTKTVTIVGACIHAVIPAWKRFASFFSTLPQPVFFDEASIASLIQVGDRWYRIGGGRVVESRRSNVEEQKSFKWIEAFCLKRRSIIGRGTTRASVVAYSPTFQLRVSLTSPRIILSSSPVAGSIARLVLRMSHLDCLHVNSGLEGKISRSFFFDQIEVYTLSNSVFKRNKKEGENSLIHPWSVAGIIEKPNGSDVIGYDKYSTTISADVLKARAAYSDMAIAIEVCLSVAQSAKSDPLDSSTNRINNSASSDSMSENSFVGSNESLSEAPTQESKVLPNPPLLSVFEAECDGFEVRVADDSGRHFAGIQDLIILKLGKILYKKRERRLEPSTIDLRLYGLDLYDCLQKRASPFRTAASTRPGSLGIGCQDGPSIGSDSESGEDSAIETRCYTWDAFQVQTMKEFQFRTSPALVARLASISVEGSLGHDGDRHVRSSGLIEISRVTTGETMQNYHVKLRSLSVQWNPSTIIAIQRFLGRLKKESQSKAAQLFEEELDELLATQSVDFGAKPDLLTEHREASEAIAIQATLELENLTVCLNKEHQNRRLLELTLSSCRIDFESSPKGMAVEGQVGNLVAWDSDNYIEGIQFENRNVLRVLTTDKSSNGGNPRFLRIHYRTFKDATRQVISGQVPDWVYNHVSEIGGIDDFLSLQVAATEFTYLKERTAELIDYLSNGLPGKGMGATSRAAKGFISKRILTKSFLEFQNDSPQVFIPQHESLCDGITLKLGDVSVRSYFEQQMNSKTKKQDWFRVLSLDLSGSQSGARMKEIFSPVTNSIDLRINLRKLATTKGGELSIRGKLSFVELGLKYSHYVLMRNVATDNISRKTNTDKWDNIEKAYSEEVNGETSAETSENLLLPSSSTVFRVAYSSNARFVRYGKAGRRKQKNRGNQSPNKGIETAASVDSHESSMDVQFELDGLSLKLTRDDHVDGISEAEKKLNFDYDIILLRVQLVEISLKTNGADEMSFHLSLFRLGLFDMGDRGRLFRQRYYSALSGGSASPKKRRRKGPRQPCPFYILAEGYAPEEEEGDFAQGASGRDGPQFVVTVDRCPALSVGGIGTISELELPPEAPVTVARVVINYLTVNALIRPIKEVLEFMSCKWPGHGQRQLKLQAIQPKKLSARQGQETPPAGKVLESKGLQLKLVAHYPRIFFLADESDARSRALVLRGLAVVNVSKITRVDDDGICHVTSSDAQLQSMESYINPDVYHALSFKSIHAEMVGAANAVCFPQPDSSEEANFSESELGVALIQPVTTGIEYCEVKRELFPTKRSVFVNIEPVSTMVSFEDLNLIETVLGRLSSERSSPNTERDAENLFGMPSATADSFGLALEDNLETFEIVFKGQRLGLGLKSENGQTIISSIQTMDHRDEIFIGDQLVAIEDEDVSSSSLEAVVKRLAVPSRPITLKFCRQSSASFPRPISSVSKNVSKSIDGKVVAGLVETKEYPVSEYTLDFKKGCKSGLVIEKSICGQFPFVQKILPMFSSALQGSIVDDTNADQIETTFSQQQMRTPKPGAVVVAIDGVPLQELGLEAAWLLLEKLSAPRDSAFQSASPGKDTDYSLTFREIHSKLWGKVETLDISSSGIALSFIDDLNGRDMPLFRAKLNALEIHAERGLGGEAHIIDVQAFSILRLHLVEKNDGTTDVKLTSDEVHDLKSDSVIAFSGMAMCSIDYFHPRVAFWEPLLEPSQLFLLLEKQAGSTSTRRPGQIAVEISDRLLHEQNFRGTVPTLGSGPQMVVFNLTDASAEVCVKAIGQFKAWRKSVADPRDDDESSLAPFEDELELRESDPFHEDEGVVSSGTFTQTESELASMPSLDQEANEQRDVRRAAAKRAAQGALEFAKKRGADSSNKGDSAKPFVLRNRTGVAIAFVQQEVNRQIEAGSPSSSSSIRFSRVGEYAGLDGYGQNFVQELGDQEDARFSMEIMLPSDEEDRMGASQGASNKVRNYEGRFPNLTIAIQAVSGIFVEPIVDLQVSKVGSTVRHLIVQKDTGNGDGSEYSIPVVWSVEIIDNRRVLTLSTAVRVVTTALNQQIEIGVQKANRSERTAPEKIVNIGVARPESPFYLPLWLALKLDAVNIFVRPRVSSNQAYHWGKTSILRFGPLQAIAGGSQGSRGMEENSGTWVWEETFKDVNYISCDEVGEGKPLWLAVFGGTMSEGTDNFVLDNKSGSAINYEEHHEVISVTIDSSVTLRNMLPMSLAWQLGHTSYESTHSVVDASSIPNNNSRSTKQNLTCGECTEIFECDYGSTELKARFKEPDGQNWSSWATISLTEAAEYSNDREHEESDDVIASVFPRARQVNVQVTNDSFGVPLTLGVRLVPKLSTQALNHSEYTRIYGVEIVVFAELWIRNITDLPLNFGCPTYQLHGLRSNSTEMLENDSVNRFNAESALMEIANLLEVGDKGTGLSKKAAREVAQTGSIESLPNQECDELLEEVFEYLEIEHSAVKRRWWASESYDSYRMNITQSNENGKWYWIDENWSIDSSGDVQIEMGSWESCRNLLAGAGSFGGNRSFDTSHSIRRRRYFRNRTGRKIQGSSGGRLLPGALHGGFQAFHQPLKDSFTREQRNLKEEAKGNQGKGEKENENDDEGAMQIAVKCGDGKWSLPATIPDSGTSHGIFRVLASRWPALTTAQQNKDSKLRRAEKKERHSVSDLSSPFRYGDADLSPNLHELCYTVSDVDGEWGEFSRSMAVSPRFLMRNDSETLTIEVKQAGTPDSTSLKLSPGCVEPFYWADFRLPGLVCVSPCVTTKAGRSIYKWSGGFDICNLGMVPLRIRREVPTDEVDGCGLVRSIRALVEIRPGTGGFGINISFREENPEGEGSLFRMENLCPFPIWLSQDGVLANPASFFKSSFDNNQQISPDYSESDGEIIRPSDKKSFALDVPYRQGKYAHRKEASLSELLHVRIALAPLGHRAGIETVKVLGLTTVGEYVRLNPSKLTGILDEKVRNSFQPVRVLAIVASDGPTRVLKFVLMNISGQDVFANPFRDVSYMASRQTGDKQVHSPRHKGILDEIRQAAMIASAQIVSGNLPEENKAKREAIFGAFEGKTESRELEYSPTSDDGDAPMDQIYSLRAQFTGFVISLVDSAPSEIAVASMRNFNMLARWNELRTNEASIIMSIGWLQLDNHVPSAPFKVAIRPDIDRSNENEDVAVATEDGNPLLMVAIALAPKHNSGIVCLRSVTVAPRNLVIAVDLAFLVRLQRFFLGLKDHFRTSALDEGKSALGYAEQKRSIPFPNFGVQKHDIEWAAAFGTENQKFYFQGLTILPAAITLSVAPARALTPTQASLEGKEVAAIHQAVRKGDVLVGNSSALLGVRVGRKNKTPLAVVRGVFKSIIVDALLRLDGACLNFSGVSLHHYISTKPQLTTYLLTHYLASLRQNVPALLGSLAAFGNPLGLIRGLGDGVSDFVSEPVRGLKKSVEELNPTYLVDGVARGTGSLARHAVGGFADSASLLTETFSKNMAVLTLDRRYAQKRDRSKQLRLNNETTVSLAGGVESGFVKLVQGFSDGVTGVVKAPIRGAEKKGIEGFAKGVGKGLLGLLVKPMIGISDAATDVMIGVKHTVESSNMAQQSLSLDKNQLRPRRPMYGRDKVLRPYKLEDAAAATLMLRTRCAGENYLSHLDMGDRVALLSIKRLILFGTDGQELMSLKFKHVSRAACRKIPNEDGSIGWAIIIVLNTPRKNGSEVEVLACANREEAIELHLHLQRGVDMYRVV